MPSSSALIRAGGEIYFLASRRNLAPELRHRVLSAPEPILRNCIGFGLWSQSADEYRAAIESGDPEYWNHEGFAYWETMVRSTVVNLSVGLNRAGFSGNTKQERDLIREVGRRVAALHAIRERGLPGGLWQGPRPA